MIVEVFLFEPPPARQVPDSSSRNIFATHVAKYD